MNNFFLLFEVEWDGQNRGMENTGNIQNTHVICRQGGTSNESYHNIWKMEFEA